MILLPPAFTHFPNIAGHIIAPVRAHAFVENPDFRDERLYKGKHIVEEIKKICEEERKKQESEKPIDENKWDDCLDAISVFSSFER